MNQYNLKEFTRSKKKWNNRAKTYDDFYKTFRGAVENYIDWELLKKYLPKNKSAKILDAAGGTGRITLPLARTGYSITLCDISPKMLNVAKKKMINKGIIDNVDILECNVRNLHFVDNSFDFVLCWDGMVDELAIKELIRVSKKGGIVSIYLNNKWAIAINKFYENPYSILTLIDSQLEDQKWKHKVFNPEEARNFFKREGIKVLDIYGVCHWTRVLNIPEEILEAQNWDEKFFNQTTKMVLKLSKEPSVKGMSRHLVLYGKKL